MIKLMVGGIILGTLMFLFIFIASKRNGQFYLAPIITFLFSILITAFGLFAIGGFEGMAYGLLGAGFLIISIVGTLLLPFFVRRKDLQQLKKKDKMALAILPILFFLMIGLAIYSDPGYWIIDKGNNAKAISGNFYQVTSISEGKKQVLLILGEEYKGKDIKVKKVSKWGSTKITVELVDGDDGNQTPYIRIGLDKINEPLKVQTTEGMVFKTK